jgi:uncharacterized protein
VGKIIFWIVVVFVILFVLRMLSVAKMRRDNPKAEPAPKDRATAGSMVRCADCGAFLPKADALPSPQGFACGDPKCVNRLKQAR